LCTARTYTRKAK